MPKQIPITGLLPGSNYVVTVSGQRPDGTWTAYSQGFPFSTLADTAAPDAPTSLVTDFTTNDLIVSWTPTASIAATDFKDFEVSLTANGKTLVYYTASSSYTLTYLNNLTGFTTAQTSIAVSIKARDTSNNLSTALTGTAIKSALNVAPTITAAGNLGGYDVTIDSSNAPQSVNYVEIFEYSGLTGNTGKTSVWKGPTTTNKASIAKPLSVNTYYLDAYYVDVFGQVGSVASTRVSATTLSPSTVDTTPPPMPTIAAGSPTITTIPITITTTSGALADTKVYYVRYKETTGTVYSSWTSVAPSGSTVTNYTIPGLKPNTSYTIECYASDGVNPANPYDVSGSTYLYITPPLVVSTATQTVSPPTGISFNAKAYAATAVWTAPSSPSTPISAYKVELWQDLATDVLLQTLETAVPNITIPGLGAGLSYYVKVFTKDIYGVYSTALTSSTITLNSAGNVTDGVAPASSPTPTVNPLFGALEVKWIAISNADPVTYEVHISATSGFTPSISTKSLETSGTFAVIKTLPAGTALAYGTTYYVKIIAKDFDGSAAAGTQASGTPSQVDNGDIAANAVRANVIQAGTITATQVDATNLFVGKTFAVGTSAGTYDIAIDATGDGSSLSPYKLYSGVGTYQNVGTAFYLDSNGKFSLKDKLYFDGSVAANASVSAATVTGSNIVYTTTADHGYKVGNIVTVTGLTNNAFNVSLKSITAVTTTSPFTFTILNDTGASGSISAQSGIASLTALVIDGAIKANSGTFNGNITVGTNANQIKIDGTSNQTTTAIYSTGAGYATGTGFWLDASGRFSLGTALKWDPAGSLDVTGTINAAVGTFTGGVLLKGTGSLYATTDSTPTGSVIFNINKDGMSFYDVAVSTTVPQTSLNTAGKFVTQSATIGNWNVASKSISKNGITLNTDIVGDGTNVPAITVNSGNYWAGMTPATGTDIALWIGQQAYTTRNLAEFQVKADGSMQIGSNFSVSSTGIVTASGANINGTLAATLGTIGGWTIDSPVIYGSNSGAVGTFTGMTSGASSYSFFAGADAKTGTNAKFTVSNTGIVTAKNLVIDGGSVTDSNLTGDVRNIRVTGNIYLEGSLIIDDGANDDTTSMIKLFNSDDATYTVTAATVSGSNIVYTTSSTPRSHSYKVGNSVTVTGLTTSTFNVTSKPITAVTTNSFTIANDVGASGSVSGQSGKSVTKWYQNPSVVMNMNKGLVVRGDNGNIIATFPVKKVSGSLPKATLGNFTVNALDPSTVGSGTIVANANGKLIVGDDPAVVLTGANNITAVNTANAQAIYTTLNGAETIFGAGNTVGDTLGYRVAVYKTTVNNVDSYKARMKLKGSLGYLFFDGDNLDISGKVSATSGWIGANTSGWKITESSISNGPLGLKSAYSYELYGNSTDPTSNVITLTTPTVGLLPGMLVTSYYFNQEAYITAVSGDVITTSVNPLAPMVSSNPPVSGDVPFYVSKYALILTPTKTSTTTFTVPLGTAGAVVAIGMLVTGTGITPNTYVTGVSGTGPYTITVNNNLPTTLPSTVKISEYAMYAGRTEQYRRLAPFKLDYFGNLIATSVSISGDITATSGSFTGAINASSGTFSGYVSAGTSRFGVGVQTNKDGIYMNAANYWYSTGEGKVGGLNIASTNTGITYDKVGFNAPVDATGANRSTVTVLGTSTTSAATATTTVTGLGTTTNSLYAGMMVVATGAPVGTYITAVGTGQITVSNPMTWDTTADYFKFADVAIYAGNTYINRSQAPFIVDYNGNLFATNAFISGNIAATSGYIGGSASGWTIGSNTLTNSNVGLNAPSTTSFTQTTSSATSSGATSIVLSSASGVTAGMFISSSVASSVPAGTRVTAVNTNTITISNPTTAAIASGSTITFYQMAFYAGSTFANRNSAPFRVDYNGNMAATNASISGSITVNTGNIDGSLRVGTNSNNYIKIDGTNSASTTAMYSVVGGTSTKADSGSGFFISSDGKVRIASSVGSLTFDGTNLKVGAWTIGQAALYSSVGTNAGTYSGMTGYTSATGVAFFAGGDDINGTNATFKVSNAGAVTAKDITITGGSLTIGSTFSVTSSGVLSATGATIGGILNVTGASTFGSTVTINSGGSLVAGNTTDGVKVDSTGLYGYEQGSTIFSIPTSSAVSPTIAKFTVVDTAIYSNGTDTNFIIGTRGFKGSVGNGVISLAAGSAAPYTATLTLTASTTNLLIGQKITATSNGGVLGTDTVVKGGSGTTYTLTATTAFTNGNVTAVTGTGGNNITLRGQDTGETVATTPSAIFTVIDGTATSSDANNGFYVDRNGKFRLAGANGSVTMTDGNLTVTGKIEATSGYIGSTSKGWTISADSIVSRAGTNKLTLFSDGTNARIYFGTGTYGNANTPFYADDTAQFSIGNKLTYSSGTLTIDGAVSIGGTTASTVVSNASTGAAKPNVYSQAAQPSGTIPTGSVWYDTDDNNKTYVYSGSAWVATETNAAGVGLGNVSNLTPQNQAQTGLIAGTTITGGGITLSGGGNIKGGVTGYTDAANAGFFIGYDTNTTSAYKMLFRNAAGTNYLNWDGANLLLSGQVISGNLGGNGSGWNVGNNLLSNEFIGLYAPSTAFMRINLVSNPSMELGITGWTATGGTAAASTTQKLVGSQSLSITSPSTVSAVYKATYELVNINPSKQYSFSLYLYDTHVAAKSYKLSVDWYDQYNNLISTSAQTSGSAATTNTWVRFSYNQLTPAAGAVTAKLNVESTTSPTASTSIYIDAVLFEKNTTASPFGYFDGNITGAAWLGLTNASTSRLFRHNLVKNPSITSATTGWTADASPVSAISRGTTNYLYGTSSISLSQSTGSAANAGFTSTNKTDIAVKAGITYTISANVYSAATGPTTKVTVYWWQSDGTTAASTASNTMTTATSLIAGWVRPSLTAIAPSNAAYATIQVQVLSAVSGTTYSVDGIMMEANANLESYIDGYQTGCEWSGAYDSSYSTQSDIYAIYAGGQSADDSPFKVNYDGSIYAKKGKIGSDLDNSWSIGDGSINYIRTINKNLIFNYDYSFEDSTPGITHPYWNGYSLTGALSTPTLTGVDEVVSSYNGSYVGYRSLIFRKTYSAMDWTEKEPTLALYKNTTGFTKFSIGASANPDIALAVGGYVSFSGHIRNMNSYSAGIFSGTVNAGTSFVITTGNYTNTAAGQHAFSASDKVIISGNSNSALNGTWTISSVGTNTITINTNTASGTITKGGTITLVVSGSARLKFYDSTGNAIVANGTVTGTAVEISESTYSRVAVTAQVPSGSYFVVPEIFTNNKAMGQADAGTYPVTYNIFSIDLVQLQIVNSSTESTETPFSAPMNFYLKTDGINPIDLLNQNNNILFRVDNIGNTIVKKSISVGDKTTSAYTLLTPDGIYAYDSAGYSTSVKVGNNSLVTQLAVTGGLTATTKSFDINHPTKENMRLRYGSLEGPENGVYVRGKSSLNKIILPEYWTGLVDENSITVSLTPIGQNSNIYVESVSNYEISIGGNISEYFYLIQGERKDVPRIEVEYPTIA